MSDTSKPAEPGRDEESVGELVKQASEQTAKLVRSEIRLAQLELQQKAKHASIGVGLFGGAGVVALLGVGAIVAMAILLLATALDHDWLAALIVAVALFAVAGVMALAGKKRTYCRFRGSFHRPGSGGQSPPSVSMARAMTASCEW